MYMKHLFPIFIKDVSISRLSLSALVRRYLHMNYAFLLSFLNLNGLSRQFINFPIKTVPCIAQSALLSSFFFSEGLDCFCQDEDFVHSLLVFILVERLITRNKGVFKRLFHNKAMLSFRIFSILSSCAVFPSASSLSGNGLLTTQFQINNTIFSFLN